MNARNTIGFAATSPRAIERAAQAWSDTQLNAHLSAVDSLEANDEAARHHLNDTHIAEAVEMVKTNIQDQIDAGRIPQELGAKLLAIFDRIDDVALECAWADLVRAQS